MPQLLVNKTMSRNGGTLICQLLESHNELFFPPFVVDLAIKAPKCWPLSGFTTIGQEDFRRKMIDKVSFWDGSSWFEARNLPVSQDRRIDRELLAAAIQFDAITEDHVRPGNLEEAFLTFMRILVEAYGDEASQALKQSNYFIIDADHSFNCGVAEASRNFSEIRFLQVIRNVYDVMASRKNMLIHHSGLFGDPRNFTLKDEVVRGEVSRWLLSVLSSVRDQEIAPDQCVTIQFESLHRNREAVMRQLAEFLDIEFTSSLLVEGRSEVATIVNKDSQFVSSSSLLRVTQGGSATVIGSSLETLNEAETEVLAEVLNGVPHEWPDAVDVPQFQDFLKEFVLSHGEAIRNNPLIQKVDLAPTAEEKMNLYSELNFGRANVNRAFVS